MVIVSKGNGSQEKSEQSGVVNHACVVSFCRTMEQITALKKKRKERRGEREREMDIR